MYSPTNADSPDRAAQQCLANVHLSIRLHLTHPRGRQRKRNHGGGIRRTKEILVSRSNGRHEVCSQAQLRAEACSSG